MIRKMRHNEDSLQKACVKWFNYEYPSLAPLLHHSPNGGFRNPTEAAKFKAMGTRAGFPDLVLMLQNCSHPFLCIELKTAQGRQTELQKQFEEKVTKVGGGVYVVVRNVGQFIEVINDYLEDTPG